MKRRMFVMFVSAAVFAFALAAHAIDRDFTVVNSTGNTIVNLYASPTTTTTWGADLLGSDVLANGASVMLPTPFEIYRGEDACSTSRSSTATTRSTSSTRSTSARSPR